MKIRKWKLKQLGLIVDELDLSTASYKTIIFILLAVIYFSYYTN